MDLSPILCTRPIALANMEGTDPHMGLRGSVRFYHAPGGILIKAVFAGLPAQGADSSVLDLTVSDHIFPVIVPCGSHSFTVLLTDEVRGIADNAPVCLSTHHPPPQLLASGVITLM